VCGKFGTELVQNWNAGVWFSLAWHDASPGLTHNQVVSSVACGATAEEAQNILGNERKFFPGKVSDNWCWWRWAGLSPDVEVGVQLGIGIPPVPLHLRLARWRGGVESIARIAESFGVPL
jgi:hypothetical protein